MCLTHRLRSCLVKLTVISWIIGSSRDIASILHERASVVVCFKWLSLLIYAHVTSRRSPSFWWSITRPTLSGQLRLMYWAGGDVYVWTLYTRTMLNIPPKSSSAYLFFLHRQPMLPFVKPHARFDTRYILVSTSTRVTTPPACANGTSARIWTFSAWPHKEKFSWINKLLCISAERSLNGD